MTMGNSSVLICVNEHKNVINYFTEGCCIFEDGSSQNGNITFSGNIYQGDSSSRKQKATEETTDIGSPLHLSSAKGTKIDLIRVMNTWYECGKVTDENGNRVTKKEFFEWVGKLFNVDLTHYEKDLSNSMSSSVAYDKQTRIFDELKEKQQEIYNSK